MYCTSSFITLITSYVSTIPFLGHVAALFLTVFQTPYFFVSDFSIAPFFSPPFFLFFSPKGQESRE